MWDCSHRLQRADREGTAAVAEAAAFSGERFPQHADHNCNIQFQSAVIGLELPGLKALMNGLQLPVPVATIIEKLLKQPAQPIHPFRAGSTATQLGDPPRQLIQQRPPHLKLLQAQISERGCAGINC